MFFCKDNDSSPGYFSFSHACLTLSLVSVCESEIELRVCVRVGERERVCVLVREEERVCVCVCTQQGKNKPTISRGNSQNQLPRWRLDL